MKRVSILLAMAVLVAVVAPMAWAHDMDQGETMSWTGEVLDLACYIPHGAMGADHAACAKRCVKSGQPMGLLTEDGKVLLLVADHSDATPYEALKDWAGSKVVVTGEMAQRDGMTVVTVTGSEAAS